MLNFVDYREKLQNEGKKNMKRWRIKEKTLLGFQKSQGSGGLRLEEGPDRSTTHWTHQRVPGRETTRDVCQNTGQHIINEDY